jgi:hypothetical protein
VTGSEGQRVISAAKHQRQCSNSVRCNTESAIGSKVGPDMPQGLKTQLTKVDLLLSLELVIPGVAWRLCQG